MESTARRMEKGEVVEGEVTELDRSWSDYQSGWVPVIGVRQADGSVRTIIAFHEILRRKLAERRPRPGDHIKITCHGEQPTKDGKRKATLYSVEGGQEPDADRFWGEMDTTPTGASAQQEIPEPAEEEDIGF